MAPRKRPRRLPVPHPFVKWAGGKRSSAEHIVSRMPPTFGRYHEPFIGGGAIFFHLHRAERLRGGAVLSDLNERLVRTWRAIRDDVDGVIAQLEGHEARHGKEWYLTVRAWDVDARPEVEVAGWFIYLNKAGFNGLYRVNKKNRFNVPFGRNPNLTICDAENLRAVAEALREVDIRHEPYDSVRERVQADDLVYFDPPYVPVSATASFTSYTRDGFTLDDQRALRDLALDLRERGATVLLSNSDTPVVRELYSGGFALDEIGVKRAINSKGSSRGEVGELLMR